MKLKLSDLLYLACLYGHSQIVGDILKFQEQQGQKQVVISSTAFIRSFQVNKETKYGFTAMEISALNGRSEILRILFQVQNILFKFVINFLSAWRRCQLLAIRHLAPPECC